MAKQQKAWLRRLQLLELRSTTCEERARRRAAARERAERKYAKMPATTRLMVDMNRAAARNLGRQHAMLCGTAELRRCEACGYSRCPNAVIVEKARAARIGPNARPARAHVIGADARATGRAEPGDTPEDTDD